MNSVRFTDRSNNVQSPEKLQHQFTYQTQDFFSCKFIGLKSYTDISMRTIRVINFLLTIFLIGLLIHSGTAAPEINQIRPNVIYRERISYFNNHLLKGNTTSSSMDLLLNSATFGFQNTAVRGDPSVVLNNGTINVSGNVTGIYRVRALHLLSGYQNSSYFPVLPVRERFSKVLANRNDSYIINTDVNRSLQAKLSFTQLRNNANISEVGRNLNDLTGFVFRTGFIGSTTINDTAGNALVTVVRFTTFLAFYLFKTSTKELVGVYEQTNHGFGNIFPTNLISYLANQSYIHQIGNSVSGLAQLQGKDRISWYYAGYNDTLGLEMYSAQFQLTQQTRALLFKPTTTSLSLRAVDLGLESFLNDLETSNGLAIEDTTVENFGTTVVDTAIKQEGSSIAQPTNPTSPSSSGTSSTPSGTDPSIPLNTQPLLSFDNSTFILGQIIALIALGIFMFYRMRK